MSDTQLSASLVPTAFQATSSAAGMTWVVFFAVSFLPSASACRKARPIWPDSAWPELASITFFRSADSDSYLALFIANTKVEV